MAVKQTNIRIRATLVRGNKSVECEWWLQRDKRQHNLTRLYVIPLAATEADERGTITIDGATDDNKVYVTDSIKSSHKRVALTEERSHKLLEVHDHLSKATLPLVGPASPSAHSNITNANGHENSAKGTPVHREPTCVFLLSDEDGYVARSDFLVYRLQGSPRVASASSFLEPLSHVSPFSPPLDSWRDIAPALEAAVGAVFLPSSQESEPREPSVVPGLERDLEQRLSFPWLQKSTIRQRRVCVVLGPQIARSWLSRWEAAAALGIRLVVLSSGDWWANDRGDEAAPTTHLREAFIPIDTTTRGRDEQGLSLSGRIVRAVESYPHPVDGVVTPTDDYLIDVARAAEALGLYTPGPGPFAIATDKWRTRMVSGGRDTTGTINGNAWMARSTGELEERLNGEETMHFPVVAKPVTGRGSEGVFRADDADELRDAVARILRLKDGAAAASAGSTSAGGVVIEDYVDGPEVDANIVLLDGRRLFAEVTDDFPCSADAASSSSGGTFNETQTHAPSGLPAGEQHAVVEATTKAVLRQGFKTGVFHCEARVRGSRAEYVARPDVPFPVMVLKEKQTDDDDDDADADGSTTPSVFLHEVNARSPGMGSSTASLYSSGVDYWALQLLCAASDWDRFAALSTPFLHAPANYISLANVAVDVTAERLRALGLGGAPGFGEEEEKGKKEERGEGNVSVAERSRARVEIDGNAYPSCRLRSSRPDVMRYIPYQVSMAKPSDWYGGHRGSWRWFTTGVVVSPRSREHALRTVDAFCSSYEELLRDGEGGGGVKTT